MPTRLLLVEDDNVSRSFLSEVLGTLPAEVDQACDIAQALQLAKHHLHDLWLIDAHLPDGDGIDCLAKLRLLHDTPALAITAGATREELDHLCASGYLEVLLKPVSIALLQGTVARLLGGAPSPPDRVHSGKLPAWDEARALAAIGGNREALRALRTLFLAELPGLRTQVLSAASDGDEARLLAVLHKLKASCAFVGATRLLGAVEALANSPRDRALATLFDFAAEDALA